MENINLILCIIIVIILLFSFRAEKMQAYGVSNRYNVDAYIDKTYGGTDSMIAKDIRFGI